MERLWRSLSSKSTTETEGRSHASSNKLSHGGVQIPAATAPAGLAPIVPTAVPEMSIDEMRTRLIQDGYVVIPRVVPPAQVLAALRVINRSLGKYAPMRSNQSPDCVNSPEVLALIHCAKAVAIIRQLIGTTHPSGGGQIALRFPGDSCDDTFRPHPNVHLHWHIDGLASEGHNSIPRGEIHNFTCLAGVLLQDVPSENMGNLIIHPGSHEELANYFNATGFQALLDGGTHGLPRIRFTRPHVQVCGRAGDLVLVNYLVAHAIAPNSSPLIRYCVYFRLHNKKNRKPGQHRPEAMLAPWVDWDGVQPTYLALKESERFESESKSENDVVHAQQAYVSGNFDDDLQIALALSQTDV